MGRNRSDGTGNASEKQPADKPSPKSAEDDDTEDGDIATPKQDRDYPEDEAP